MAMCPECKNEFGMSEFFRKYFSPSAQSMKLLRCPHCHALLTVKTSRRRTVNAISMLLGFLAMKVAEHQGANGLVAMLVLAVFILLGHFVLAPLLYRFEVAPRNA
jgi:CXXC-20-CXXC protein